MGVNDDKMFWLQMIHTDYIISLNSDVPLRFYGCISGNILRSFCYNYTHFLNQGIKLTKCRGGNSVFIAT